MKKLMILALCLGAATAGLSAQEQVLKDAERALKAENPNYGAISQSLRGAMADPTTKDDVRTWYLAGKSGFGEWTNGYAKMMLGQGVDKKAMSHGLIDGYGFFCHALPLDTVVDAKGKVKTKYSKEILKNIATNSENFYNAGAFLYEEKDFGGAYEAWKIYTDLPFMTQLGKDAPAVPADSIMAQNLYNMGIFAYTAEMYPEASEAFAKAAAYDYPGCDAYNNAIACAGLAGDKARKMELAKIAFEKRGSENPGYIGELINGYIEDKQYDEAQQWIRRAIENDPTNAQLYNALGILIESQIPEDADAETVGKASEEVMGCYKKAVDLQPEGAMWNYHYGRMLANKAYRIGEAANDLPTAEYNKVRDEQVLPLFKEAATYLEKAISIDLDNTRQALPMLRNIYYNLGQNEDMERIQAL